MEVTSDNKSNEIKNQSEDTGIYSIEDDPKIKEMENYINLIFSGNEDLKKIVLEELSRIIDDFLKHREFPFSNMTLIQ